MLSKFDIENLLQQLQTEYDVLYEIVDSKNFEIKSWKENETFVMNDLVKYNGDLYIVNVDSTNKPLFDNNDFKILTTMAEEDIKELIESYFYEEKKTKWVRVNYEEPGVTKVVVPNETVDIDENNQIRKQDVIEDIPDIQVGQFVKSIESDTSIYRRKDDSMSKDEINEIKEYLESNIHVHKEMSRQQIFDYIGNATGGSIESTGIIDDNSTSLNKTWSSWFINRKLLMYDKICSKLFGMRRMRVDSKPTNPDPDVIYFVKRENSDIHDVYVFLDADDKVGIILNNTEMSINGEKIATKQWIIDNKYVKDENLHKIAKTGEFADLENVPSGIPVLEETTKEQFDLMQDEDKNKLINGLKVLWFVKK